MCSDHREERRYWGRGKYVRRQWGVKEAPVNCNKREDKRGLKELTLYYAFFPLEGKLKQE